MMKPYLTLTRAGLSSFAACSAAAGSLLAPAGTPAAALHAALSVFLLACGASALNQAQERDIDAKMERTRSRPVASGAMTVRKALVIAFSLLLFGLFLISLKGLLLLFPGVAAILWYNGLYTYLKKRSAFAAVPGALVGAIPPAIGWMTAGGTLLDSRLFSLCALLFLWQVPHFWLLALRYRGEYAQAGLPTPLTVLSPRQVGRLTFIWIAATAAATLALPLFGITRSPAVYLLLLPASLWLVGKSSLLFREEVLPAAYGPVFSRINFYLLLIMLT
ncbi:MAG TPA: UbiA family prenyltransferase, partial [Nitrospirota bacterium]|nr:UbiA family prenyltransferase [Nitrospirota bacterium]